MQTEFKKRLEWRYALQIAIRIRYELAHYVQEWALMSFDFLSESKRSLYLNPQVMVLAIDAMLVMLGFGLISPSLSFYLIALEGGIDEPP